MIAKPRRYVRQMPRIYGNLQSAPLPIWRWLQVFLRIFIVILALAYLVYFIFFGPAFRIKQVEVTGTALSSAAYARSVVPIGSNIWLLQSDQVKSQILRDPTVLSVSVLRGLPHTIHLVINEQPVAASWISGQELALINNQGIIFKIVPLSQETALHSSLQTLPRIIDTQNLPVQTNQVIVSPAFIQFVNQLTTNLSSIHSVTLDHFAVTDSTYSVTAVMKQGMQVEFSTVADPGVQVRNLDRLITQAKLPANAQVDLRVNRWAYVKAGG